jgi:trigger factor
VKHTVTQLNETEQEMLITAEPSEFQSEFDKTYQKYQANAEFKGFRKGKVPMGMIKQTMGKVIEEEVAQTLAQKFFEQVAETDNVKMMGKAHIHGFDYKENESLTITLHYEVQPVFTLADYAKYEFSRTVYTVSDDDVQKEIEYVLKSKGTLMATDDAAGESDFVIADLQKLDEQGFPVIGKKFENQTISLGDANVHPNFKSALVGVKAGDERRLELDFKNRENNSEQIDKYLVIVREVKRLELPEISDDLVAEVTKGRQHTVAEFKDALHNEIDTFYKRKSEEDLREAVARKFVDDNDIPVPNSLAESFINSFLEDLKSRNNVKELPKGFDVVQFRKEVRPNAVRQAKWFLIKYKLAEVNNLRVEEADIEKLIDQDAASMPNISRDQIATYYKSPNMQAVLADRVLNEKVYDSLKASAKITETTKSVSEAVKESETQAETEQAS